MDRLREPVLEAQYRLAIRLTQIELGQEQAFATEMASQLAENPPAPDWLLTAAAVELHRNNLAAAASYLDKASGLMDKELFNMRLRDYFFYSYRFEKSLARFYRPAASPAPAAAPAPSASPAAAATPGMPALPEVSPLLQGKPADTDAPLQSEKP